MSLFNYIETMIIYLREKKYDHIIPHHDKVVNTMINNTFLLNKDIDRSTIVQFSVDKSEDIQGFMSTGRFLHNHYYSQLVQS